MRLHLCHHTSVARHTIHKHTRSRPGRNPGHLVVLAHVTKVKAEGLPSLRRPGTSVLQHGWVAVQSLRSQACCSCMYGVLGSPTPVAGAPPSQQALDLKGALLQWGKLRSCAAWDKLVE